MTLDPAKGARVVAAYLDDVDGKLEAVQRLVADPPNRFAAFHLQQAAEKLVKAVRLTRGLHLTKEHSIEVLANELPQEDAWRAKLIVLEPLSAYATAFRYPTSSGKRKDGLTSVEALAWIKTIAALCAEARVLVSGIGPNS